MAGQRDLLWSGCVEWQHLLIEVGVSMTVFSKLLVHRFTVVGWRIHPCFQLIAHLRFSFFKSSYLPLWKSLTEFNGDETDRMAQKLFLKLTV